MKKLFFLGALFAAGLCFTACSSDKDVADENQPFENGGGSYIAVSINLPTTPTAITRATDNADGVTLEDGLDIEYAVKNATLIIFDGSENFLEAHNLGTLSFTSSSDPHVTQYASSTNIIETVSKKVFAGCKMLVILNNNDLISTESYALKVNEGGTMTNFTGTYSQLQAKINVATTTGLNAVPMAATTEAGITESGLYMSNAPLSDTQGSVTTPAPSAAKVQVLVPISQTYKTAELATNATTPDKIYVERGMAKVTMASGSGTLTNAKGNGSTAVSWSTTAWTLDNTNTTSYLVRSTDGFDDFKGLISHASGAVYRTIGNLAIAESTPTPYKYRTYFAKGTNWGGTGSLTTVTGESNFSDKFYDDGTTYAKTNPQYCYENTFPVSRQSIVNTTLVQLKVTSQVGGAAGNLYTIGTDKSTVYVETDIATKIAAAASALIAADASGGKTYVESGTSVKSSDFTITEIKRDETTGLVNGAVIQYTGTGDAPVVLKTSAYKESSTLSDDLCSKIVTKAITDNGTMTQYVGGVSYYHIRIKHFGDGLTPWNNGEYTTKPAGNTISTIYPTDVDQDGNYLGRYGVLRNNWYHLAVSSIRFLGDAVPHTGSWPDTPDDEVDEYIAFKIHVLSWAKRTTQNADL